MLYQHVEYSATTGKIDKSGGTDVLPTRKPRASSRVVRVEAVDGDRSVSWWVGVQTSQGIQMVELERAPAWALPTPTRLPVGAEVEVVGGLSHGARARVAADYGDAYLLAFERGSTKRWAGSLRLVGLARALGLRTASEEAIVLAAWAADRAVW